MALSFRDEFRCRHFRLTYGDPEVFGSCQWRWPRPVFLIYRLLAASYVIGWNIYSYVTIPTFGHHVTLVFYTNWSYLVLGLHLTLALLVTLRHAATSGTKPLHQPITAPSTGHVITICDGACADLPGSVPHYHLDGCRVGVSAKRGQGDEGKGRQDVAGKQDPIEAGQRGDGNFKRKHRAKVRDHNLEEVMGSRAQQVKKVRSKQRGRSVGVNCGGMTDIQFLHNQGNRSHDHQNRTNSGVRHKSKNQTSDLRRSLAEATPEVGPNRASLLTDGNKKEEPTLGPERRRRVRRRASRACPGGRLKRPVGFRSRSSNSSLDKIRFRSGRRSTPELKRRCKRQAQKRETDSVPKSTGHRSRHVERDATDCLAPHQTSQPSRSKCSGSKPTGRIGESQPGEASTNRMGEEVKGQRRKSKSKGKHTFILQRSRGTPQRLTKYAEQIEQGQPKSSHAVPAVDGKPSISRPTRSVGTNTTAPAALPQRISVIVDTPPLDTSQPTTHPELPLYIKVSWVVFNIAAASAPVVSAVYFFVLFPMLRREQPSFQASALDLNLHGINSLIVLLEVSISAIPVRLLHGVFPLLYGLSYVVFSAAYWGLDKENNVLYPVILDWNKPGVALGVVSMLVGVATPVFQLMWYGVYRLRRVLYRRLYKDQPNQTQTGAAVVSDTHRKETQV